jgi:hypothetical protein
LKELDGDLPLGGVFEIVGFWHLLLVKPAPKIIDWILYHVRSINHNIPVGAGF